MPVATELIQINAASGLREMMYYEVEHQTSGERSATISRDDLRRILGDVDDAKIIEILDLKPTLPEVEQAAIWATGDGDVLAKSGHPLAGVASDIVDILTADEEEPPPIR